LTWNNFSVTVSNSLTVGTGKSGGIAMFDKLIESDSVGADFKSRRRYFLVSSLVVGALFISAVVISIYAADISLGNDNYELSAMIAPVDLPPSTPEPPQPQSHPQTTNERSDRPQRQVNMPRVDEEPREIPPVSVNPNTQAARPRTDFQLGRIDTDPPSGPVFTAGNGPGNGSSSGAEPRNDTVSDQKPVPPPEPPPAAPARPRSIGVANGYALDLPKPPYPAPALAIHADGKVDVQITIDEEGRVISAKAVSGHPLLRQVSERAALSAKFKPTLLSNVPVKVTGVIVYNFTR
jgi:protein TonB